MSSDNRFMYSQPQPQAIATNYDYSSYPPPTHAAASYENGQIHPSQQRPPLRSTSSSQPHSPTQPTHFHQPQPQPTYSTQSQTYAPAPYVSQSQSQWSAQGWSYSPVYPPQQPPPPSEPSYKSEPQYNGSPTSRMDTRMDTRPSPPPEQRGYAPPPNPNPPRVAEDRPPPPPHHAHHSSHPPPPHQPAHQPSHQPSHQPTHQPPHQHSQQQQQQHQPPPPQHHLSHPPPPPHQQQVNHQHPHQPHHQPPVHASQPPPNHVGPPPKRLREMESPPMASAPMPPPPITPVGPPPHSLDFMKLVESYQVIIHTGDSLSRSSAPGRPFPLDAIDKMLQSATYGVQIFESTSNLPASPALSEVRPPSEEQPPPEPQQPPQAQEPTTNGTAPAAKKQKTEEPSQDGQTCLGCKATSTPEWRRGPMGPRTLCNACGLVYAKMIKKRTRESLRANGKTNGQNGAAFNGNGGDEGASNGEDDSDAESYGSQDHKDT